MRRGKKHASQGNILFTFWFLPLFASLRILHCCNHNLEPSRPEKSSGSPFILITFEYFFTKSLHHPKATMNQLLVFVILALFLSPCLGQAHGEEEHLSSEELDPADVEEEGCPRITHLQDIDLRHVSFYNSINICDN